MKIRSITLVMNIIKGREDCDTHSKILYSVETINNSLIECKETGNKYKIQFPVIFYNEYYYLISANNRLVKDKNSIKNLYNTNISESEFLDMLKNNEVVIIDNYKLEELLSIDTLYYLDDNDFDEISLGVKNKSYNIVKRAIIEYNVLKSGFREDLFRKHSTLNIFENFMNKNNILYNNTTKICNKNSESGLVLRKIEIPFIEYGYDIYMLKDIHNSKQSKKYKDFNITDDTFEIALMSGAIVVLDEQNRETLDELLIPDSDECCISVIDG